MNQVIVIIPKLKWHNKKIILRSNPKIFIRILGFLFCTTKYLTVSEFKECPNPEGLLEKGNPT